MNSDPEGYETTHLEEMISYLPNRLCPSWSVFWCEGCVATSEKSQILCFIFIQLHFKCKPAPHDDRLSHDIQEAWTEYYRTLAFYDFLIRFLYDILGVCSLE